MNPTDTKILKDRLSELADALGARGPGDSGMKAWYIALKDFGVDEVVDSLDQWLRTKGKMPTPSDIRLILAGRLSDRIERQAIVDKGQFAAGARAILGDRKIGHAHLDKIRQILSRKPAEPDDWWHKLITRWRAGEVLAWMQMVNAKLAWENSGRPEESAPPGTPDAELIAERAAIQAEGNA